MRRDKHFSTKIGFGGSMNIYISMLRGINVGGHNRISMDALKKLYASLGLKDVVTYMQSGNAIFRSSIGDEGVLAKQITDRIKSDLKLDVPVVIRKSEHLHKIIKGNPFADQDLSKVHVAFMSETVKNPPVHELEKTAGKDEKFQVSGSEVYMYLPHGVSKTKLSNSHIEKKLKVSATMRNWNTVNRLFDMAK
jgi:uncharacterized protein (DUF1697 family)